MSKRKSRRSLPETSAQKHSHTLSDSRTSTADLPFRSWLLAAMAMLFVARPLVPSEGVAWIGDGQPFCMMWLLLGLATAFAAIKAGGLPRRFGWTEWLVVVFAVLHSLAAWRGSMLNNPRPTVNMLWEGVAMAVSFLLARQLVASAREARILIAVMIALAAIFSVLGFYQVFVGLPADRIEYARNPDETLRRAGQWYAPGSPERIAFENRLQSKEPLATFALTNSLAGYLAPWLLIAIGIVAGGKRGKFRGLILGLAVLIAGCLLLTRSRSAFAASLLGMLLLCTWTFREWLMHRRKLALGVTVSVAVLVTALFATGQFDKSILTDAGKSFGYRLEYWKATTAMIGDRPFFGVGPGNFQDFYTQYKLPAASEEIRDPHSWLFEIAATAGLPALLVLCVVLAAGVYRIVIAKPQEVVDDARSISDWFVYGGAATALIVAFILGPLAGLPFGIEKLLCGLAVGGTALYALRDWVRQGNLSPQMIAIAIGVMMVNLLAAGGIMYPGVAGTLWLLLALSLNLAEPRVFAPSKLVPATALGAIVVLALVQYLTGYSPVLQCQGAMLEALNVANNPQAQEQVLMFATEVDPRAAEPWQELAAMRLRAWEAQGGAGSLQDFRQASQRLLELRPHSASAHRLVGKWWLQVYEKSPTPGNADNAVVNLSRAVELYPNHPVIRSELAIALSDAGNRTAAQREAQKSMELDGATPHADKKLSVAIRQRMAQILEETPASPR